MISRRWMRQLGCAAFINLLASPCYAVDASTILDGAKSGLATFGPAAALTNILIGDAIDHANTDAQQRLDQLEGIIHSSIFQLNQVLHENIESLDAKARQQRWEAVQQLQQLAAQINTMIHGDLSIVDAMLAKNIVAFNSELRQTFASLPIPVTPVVNVGRGFTILKQAGDYTKLSITGSGFTKTKNAPTATLRGPTGNEEPVYFDAYSMGLLQMAIPNKLLGDATIPQEYTLTLRFSKAQSFPLSVCGALPRYTVEATMYGSDGKGWQLDVVNKGTVSLNCTGGTVDELNIYPSKETPTGWKVDGDRPGFTKGGYHYDNDNGSEGRHRVTEEADHLHLECVKQDSGAGSHTTVNGVKIAIKREQDMDTCGTAPSLKLEPPYEKETSANLSLAPAIGACDRALKPVTFRLRVAISNRRGQVEDERTFHIPINAHESMLGGMAEIWTDELTKVYIRLRPQCRPHYSYLVEN